MTTTDGTRSDAPAPTTLRRGRPLQVGIMLPAVEREMGRATARWPDLLAMARYAEALGFDSLWLPDHFIFRHPGIEPQGVWECWSLLAALAAGTERVELGSLVSATSWRNPALLAKTADTVDEIGGGRLVLGLGAGWYEPEYRAFGYPYDHRTSRFAEAVAIIHGLLRDGRVDLDGTYHQARDCELRPRGPRPQGPPLMIGTSGERMLELTARYADRWNVSGRNRPDEIPALRERVDAACRAVGRDPATLARSAVVMVELPGKVVRERPIRSTSGPLAGSPEELAEAFRGYAREGIAHLMVIPNPNSLAGIEELARVVEILDRGEGAAAGAVGRGAR